MTLIYDLCDVHLCWQEKARQALDTPSGQDRHLVVIKERTR